MKAVGYFRELAGAARADGVARQNRRFLDYCDAQGYEVAATFADDAKNSQGPGFAQLIDYLRRPEKGFVIVATPLPATLAEDPVVAAARCLQIERMGASLQFIDLPTPNTGDALTAVLQNWSSGRDDALRDRVRSALRRKAVRGEVLGRPPYGYRVGARNRLELVEDEALVVRYIFRLYLQEGLGIRLIARRLNEEGLRTRRNRPWSMVSIRDILRNRAYLGTYQRLGVRVPGTHPAIVTADDFRRVQERLEERRTNYSERKVTGFLLSGLAVCGSCGNRMIGVSRRQTWTRRRDGSEQVASYRYYQCESRTNQGLCSYNTQRAEELEEKVRSQLADTDPKLLAVAGGDTGVIAQWQEESRRLRERLQQVDRRLARSLEAAASDKLSFEKLRSQGLTLADERLKLEEELRDAEWRSEHYASASERRRTRGAALKLLVNQWTNLSLGERQQLVREMVEQVRVGGEGEPVEIKLRP